MLELAIRNAMNWGPGMLFAVLIIVAFYKLVFKIATDVGLKILAALEKPSTALDTQAEALTKQSHSIDRLTLALEDYVSRDRNEHREMIILLKVISNRLDQIDDRQEETKHGV